MGEGCHLRQAAAIVVFWVATATTTAAAQSPPPTPTLVKPADLSVVTTLRPTLEVSNVTDPDGEAVEFYFQIATDDQFTNIVSENTVGVPQDTGTTTTTWVVDIDLQWGASYWARCYARDATGLKSGYCTANSFSIKCNCGVPTAPGLSTPFDLQCSGAIFDTGNFDTLSRITVNNSTDANGGPMDLHLQLYAFGDDPDASGTSFFVDATLPQSNTGTTLFDIDPSSFPENAQFEIRVRSTDGFDYSPAAACDFWVNRVNGAPSAVEILTPKNDDLFGPSPANIPVEVTLATDPDSVVPATALYIAFCFDVGDVCPPSASEWENVPQAREPGPTRFELTHTLAGAPIAPVTRYELVVCAMDETGTCGPTATVSFATDQGPGVLPGLDGGTEGDGGTKGDGGTAGTRGDGPGECGAGCPLSGTCVDGECIVAEGGCACSTRGGQPDLLLWLLLPGVLVRRRRRR